MNTKPLISIITPTTGKDSLFRLIESLNRQSVPFEHILLWDDKRDDDFLYPTSYTLEDKDPNDLNSHNRYSIVINGTMVQGQACGSALRAIGLMAANTPFVTFADDDVWYEDDHLMNLLNAVNDKKWSYCRRKIWANEKDCIGIDNFESVGDSPDRKVPYEMVDNNCMIFARRLGTSGAVLYRETTGYDDDRLFYDFLKKHAGEPMKLTSPSINQVCPERLLPMFRQNCTKV